METHESLYQDHDQVHLDGEQAGPDPTSRPLSSTVCVCVCVCVCCRLDWVACFLRMLCIACLHDDNTGDDVVFYEEQGEQEEEEEWEEEEEDASGDHDVDEQRTSCLVE